MRFSLVWSLLLLFLVACNDNAQVPAIVVPTSTAVPATDEPTPPPLTATVRPTITPQPTAVMATITAEDQTLDEDGELAIGPIFAPQNGWAVIYTTHEDQPQTMLGFAPVTAGSHDQLFVSVEPGQASESLVVRLHADLGSADVFEFPGPDQPFESASAEHIFEVDIDLPMASLEVGDQDVGAEGEVTVARVEALQASWIVIHTLEDENIGPVVGAAPVIEGVFEEVTVPIRWRDASQELIAVLYEDANQPGGFQAAEDLPVLFDNQPVTSEFTVTLPPDILVYDQPVLRGNILVDRVISRSPGWLVVYTDQEGQPGVIIGFAFVAGGLNERVTVEVIETAVTPRLYLVLHEDTDEAGEFDFPAGDLPATYDDEPLSPVPVGANPGNYLISRDQVLDENGAVFVDLVVTDLDTWLVIYLNEEGRMGEIVGRTWLPAGLNHDVPVQVDAPPDAALFAVLHQDVDRLQEFDYPDGNDNPLQRNRSILRSPFALLSPPNVDPLSPPF